MLQSIRDRTHGLVAGIIITLLILSFALWGIHSYFTGNGASDVIATVNGNEITKPQFSRAYERIRRQLQSQSALADYSQARLKESVLQSLISIEALKEAATQSGFRISDEQIDQALQTMPEFQVNGEFSLQRFEQAMSLSMYTPQDFINIIKTRLLIDQPRLGLIFTSFSLPDEVQVAAKLIEQERDIQYVVIPTSSITKDFVITEKDINEYYKSHQTNFKVAEQISVDYIKLSTKDLALKIKPNLQALQKFYTENKSNFTSPTKWQYTQISIPLVGDNIAKASADAQTRLAQLATDLKGGKDLVVLAQENGAQMTEHNWTAQSEFPIELQKEVSKLTVPGQLSKPVRLNNSMVLIKVTGYQPAKDLSFEEAKAKVVEVYSAQQAEEQFANLREKMANTTYEHPDSLAKSAKDLSLPILTTGFFSKDKGGADISSYSKVREAAFSNEVLTLRNNSDLIQLDPDTVVAVRIKEYHPAKVLPLKDVQHKITEILTLKELQQRAAHLANDIKMKLETGHLKADELNVQYKLSFNQVGYVGRHAEKVDSHILDAAFSVPYTENGVKNVYTVVKLPDGYAVVSISGIKSPTLTPSSQQYQTFSEQVQNTQGLLEYELFKDSEIAHAKVVILQ